MNFTVTAVNHLGKKKRQWLTKLKNTTDQELILCAGEPLLIYFPDGTQKQFPYIYREHYFFESWYNVLEVFDKRKFKEWYVNIAAPPTIKDSELIYMDFDLDYIVYPDYSVKTLDQDEFDANNLYYSTESDEPIQKALDDLKEMIKEKKYPFVIPSQ